MQIHNVNLYHCLKCGHLVRTDEPEENAPRCCDQRMVKAGAATVAVVDDDNEPLPAEPAGAASVDTAANEYPLPSRG